MIVLYGYYQAMMSNAFFETILNLWIDILDFIDEKSGTIKRPEEAEEIDHQLNLQMEKRSMNNSVCMITLP